MYTAFHQHKTQRKNPQKLQQTTIILCILPPQGHRHTHKITKIPGNSLTNLKILPT